MRKVNVMKLTICFAAFLLMLNTSLAEARSLKVGEVYKSFNGRRVIEVISKNEMEIAGTPGVPDTIIAEYSFKGDKLRIVIPMFGTRVVNYYEITKEGLKDKDGGVLYSKKRLAKAASEALPKQIRENDWSQVRTLLNNGADVNVKLKDGWTVLTLATYAGHTDIAKLLIDYGADVNAKMKDGTTDLEMAVLVNKPEMVKLLIKNGADVNAKDKEGSTLLMQATFDGHTNIVKLLIDHGADVNAKDKDGDTALKSATTSLAIATVATLESAKDVGDDVENYKKILRILKNAGAKE